MSIGRRERNGVKILYIEDNPENRMLVRALLESEGYTLVDAEEGLAGIEAALREQPALILLDMNLPGVDGYEVGVILKSFPSLKQVPIVAVTAYAMEGDRQRTLVAGCDGYIAKPIDADAFPRQVADFLRGKREWVEEQEAPAYLRELNQRLVYRLVNQVEELKRLNQHFVRRASQLADLHHAVQGITSELGVAEMLERLLLAVARAIGTTSLRVELTDPPGVLFLQIDGLGATTANGDGSNTAVYHNDLAYEEVSFQTSGIGAEFPAGGIRINMVPKDGGNSFKGAAFVGYSPGKLQSDNMTPELAAAGLKAVPNVLRIFDYNVAYGGPIKHDRLWFFATGRYWGVDQGVTGEFDLHGNQGERQPAQECRRAHHVVSRARQPEHFYQNVDNLNIPPRQLMEIFSKTQQTFYRDLAKSSGGEADIQSRATALQGKPASGYMKDRDLPRRPPMWLVFAWGRGADGRLIWGIPADIDNCRLSGFGRLDQCPAARAPFN